MICHRMLMFAALLAAPLLSETLPNDLRLKVESRAKQLLEWGSDPKIVSAVKAHNASLSAAEQAMTNEKWKGLTQLDPFVRAYSKNEVAQYLKSKKDESISEAFVSGADGTKVAFLAKTTSWSHKGRDKHQIPMSGKTWYGPVEVDESSGTQQIQVGFPVLDGGKPIGSIVVGLSVAKLR